MTTKAIEAGALALDSRHDVWTDGSAIAVAKLIIGAAIASGELVPASADRTTLHSVISNIREKSGLGGKPMLSELADAIAEKIASAVAAERERCAQHIEKTKIRIPTGMGIISLVELERQLDEALKKVADTLRALEPASGEYVLVPRAALAVVIRKIEWFDDKAGYQSRELEQAINDIETALINAATSNGSGK